MEKFQKWNPGAIYHPRMLDMKAFRSWTFYENLNHFFSGKSILYSSRICVMISGFNLEVKKSARVVLYKHGKCRTFLSQTPVLYITIQKLATSLYRTYIVCICYCFHVELKDRTALQALMNYTNHKHHGLYLYGLSISHHPQHEFPSFCVELEKELQV